MADQIICMALGGQKVYSGPSDKMHKLAILLTAPEQQEATAATNPLDCLQDVLGDKASVKQLVKSCREEDLAPGGHHAPSERGGLS